MSIKFAEKDSEIENCFPILEELYPDLEKNGFVQRIRIQFFEGYKLVYLEKDNQVVTVAGFRILHTQHWGKILFLDDIVTLSAYRWQGNGGKMLKWLEKEARHHACQELHLSSSFHRHQAHAVYLKYGYRLLSHYFTKELR
jgi:GNAT superfamily N-acetyltransferase